MRIEEKIKDAIRETLVVENKESLDVAVQKIVELVYGKGSKAERCKNMKCLTLDHHSERFLIRTHYLTDFAETEAEIGEVQIPMVKNAPIKISRIHCLRF